MVCTSARTIGLVVGAAVVGVAVVSAPERSICVGLGRYSHSKKGTLFLFHRDYNVDKLAYQMQGQENMHLP